MTMMINMVIMTSNVSMIGVINKMSRMSKICMIGRDQYNEKDKQNTSVAERLIR